MGMLPEFVRGVLTRLENAGFEAWCVGGCVRDLLLDRCPADWDVTTSALPEQTLALFGADARPTGLRHGTVTVGSGREAVEITTYRVDGIYRDHRRPEQVTFTPSLEEDLRRRDFTVNAVAMDLRGMLRDPFGGRADLERAVLRCVGEPERRFEEDALRMLRGLRFASVLGFSIHPDTAAAIHRCRGLLEEIAPERIQAELWGVLTGKHASAVLREFPDVPGVFWPEILPMVGFDQRNRHHCYDVWEHTIHALAAVPPETELRCAMLLHDIGKPRVFVLGTDGCGHFRGHQAAGREMADQMLRRLKCSGRLRETVVQLVEWHDRGIPPEERAVCRVLRQLGEEQLRRLLAVKRADNLAQAPAFRGRQEELRRVEAVLERVLAARACVSLRDLAVKGNDIMELGLEGPAVGHCLEMLLDGVVEQWLPNDRAVLLEQARRFAAGL